MKIKAMAKWFFGLHWWVRLPLVILCLLMLFLLWRDTRPPRRDVSPDELAPLSLEGVERILVLAPHCDDETLGPGGLIAAAEQEGKEVRVAIATNGDGYLFATIRDFRKVYPRPKDYIHMGTVRQQESLAALSMLGVPAEKVYFLGYPDRGTPSLWTTHWDASNPYKSPYNGASKSPYPLTYNPESVYAGEDYLADVTTIMADYRPDLVIYPHPDDIHPDHWGLNAFTRLALTELSHKDPSYQPRQLTYLVHRPDFPVVRGFKPAEALVPPPALYAIYPDWYRWDLAVVDEALKGEAVLAYRSQLSLLRGFMESFVRSNELFAPVVSQDLPVAVAGVPNDPSTWQDAAKQPIASIQLDPVQDYFLRRDLPGTDLAALYAARSGDILWACAQLRVRASDDVPYTFQLKALTETSIVPYMARSHKPRPGEGQVTLHKDYACFQVPLLELGDPWAIHISVETQSPDANLPFDQTAWQMVYVR